MATDRRHFLKILGGGTLFAASGAGIFLSTRTPHAALTPWDQAGHYEDVRKWALSYALLAPNPHNRQPWLVDLSQTNSITIYRDKLRDLPHTDPYSRQLTVGMGCFLELLAIAASQRGHHVDYVLYPKGEEGPVAHATFSLGAKPDPLFAQVMNRRSCKEPFLMDPLSEQHAAALRPYCQVISEADPVAQLKTLTLEAWMVEANTPRTLQESVDLMRIGKSEINANPDGIDLGGPFLETLNVVGILTRENQLDPKSSGFKQGMEIYRQMLTATPAYCALTTKGNSRLEQISAGRQWLRLNLKTTELGLALHPVSQALQEYPEMATHYRQAHQLLAKPGETVQLLGRLGHGPVTPRSPRWPLEAKIIHA